MERRNLSRLAWPLVIAMSLCIISCYEDEKTFENPNIESESALYSLEGIDLNGWDEGVYYDASEKETSFYVLSHKDSLDGSVVLCVSPAENEDVDAALLFQYDGDLNLCDVFYAGYRFSARVNADTTVTDFIVYNSQNEVEGSFSVPMVPIEPAAETRSPFFNSKGNFSVSKTVDFGRLAGEVLGKAGNAIHFVGRLSEGNIGDITKDFLMGKVIPPLPKNIPMPRWLQLYLAELFLRGSYDKLREFYMGQAEIQISSVKRTSETTLTVQGIVSGIVTIPTNRCVVKYGVVVGKNENVGYHLNNLRLGPETVTGKSSHPFTFTFYAETQPGEERYFRPYLIPEFTSEGYYSPITFIRYGEAKRFIDMDVKLENFKQVKTSQDNGQYIAQFTIDGSIPGVFSDLSNWGFDVKTASGTTTRFYAKESEAYYPPTSKTFTCDITLERSDYKEEGGELLATVTLIPFIMYWNSFPPMEFFDPQEYTISLGLLSCPDDHHPHAIDLGLPSGTKWCCCNVGASKPEDYGGYYAWGETSEKSVYNGVTYKYFNGQDTDGDGWIDENFSVVSIGSDIAGTGYDVARVRMGAPWRMPTIDQDMELSSFFCSYQWTQQNGVNGLLVTGPNRGQIFLPAAGDRWYGELLHAGSYGIYCSSSLYPGYGYYACDMYFYSNIWYWDYYYRYYGRSVRAVCP